MFKGIFNILAIGLIFTHASCVKKADACFEVEKPDPKVNQEIKFDAACSGNAHNFFWRLNGKIIGSNFHLLKYKFPTPGKYIIELEVQNKYGWGENTQKEITVVK